MPGEVGICESELIGVPHAEQNAAEPATSAAQRGQRTMRGIVSQRHLVEAGPSACPFATRETAASRCIVARFRLRYTLRICRVCGRAR